MLQRYVSRIPTTTRKIIAAPMALAYFSEIKDDSEEYFRLDLGHSEISPLPTRQERAGAVWK
jgi:hypothetical protein